MHEDILEIYNRALDMVIKLGLPSDLLHDLNNDILQNDRDTLFILKAHALMEELITHLLTLNIRLHNQSEEHNKKFTQFLSSLSMIGKNGSLKLAHDLGIITKDIYDFANALIDVRNTYAHSIKSMRLSLEEVCETTFKNHNHNREKLDITKAFQKDPSLPNSTVKLLILLGIQHCLSYAHTHIHNKPVTLLGSD